MNTTTASAQLEEAQLELRAAHFCPNAGLPGWVSGTTQWVKRTTRHVHIVRRTSNPEGADFWTWSFADARKMEWTSGQADYPRMAMRASVEHARAGS